VINEMSVLKKFLKENQGAADQLALCHKLDKPVETAPEGKVTPGANTGYRREVNVTPGRETMFQK